MPTIHQDTLRARRLWNTAAHKARELPEYAALELLHDTAENIAALLRPHVLHEPSDDDVEAGCADGMCSF